MQCGDNCIGWIRTKIGRKGGSSFEIPVFHFYARETGTLRLKGSRVLAEKPTCVVSHKGPGSLFISFESRPYNRVYSFDLAKELIKQNKQLNPRNELLLHKLLKSIQSKKFDSSNIEHRKMLYRLPYSIKERLILKYILPSIADDEKLQGIFIDHLYQYVWKIKLSNQFDIKSSIPASKAVFF